MVVASAVAARLVAVNAEFAGSQGGAALYPISAGRVGNLPTRAPPLDDLSPLGDLVRAINRPGRREQRAFQGLDVGEAMRAGDRRRDVNHRLMILFHNIQPKGISHLGGSANRSHIGLVHAGYREHSQPSRIDPKRSDARRNETRRSARAARIGGAWGVRLLPKSRTSGFVGDV